MAYRHYETEGLVVGHRNLGEANRLYQILTADFGLINVLAQGVRRDRSKLRYHLQNFSFAHLVLVRGREFWRLVGASELESLKSLSKETAVFLRKLALVLQRLVQGEDPHSFIYQDLKQASLLLIESDQQSAQKLANLEIFILARFLTQLGYLAPSAETRDLLASSSFSWLEIGQMENFRTALIKQINQALVMTQL